MAMRLYRDDCVFSMYSDLFYVKSLTFESSEIKATKRTRSRMTKAIWWGIRKWTEASKGPVVVKTDQREIDVGTLHLARRSQK